MNSRLPDTARSHILFSLRTSLMLSEKISISEERRLGPICFKIFSDGEFEPFFENSIRGAMIFLIGSTFAPQDNFMELLLICDAAYRASVQSITVVIPYYGWGRQDRKEILRAPIAAKLATKLLATAKATRVIVLELHANQIQGFFDIPIDQIYASKIFIEYLKLLNRKNLTIASTDLGGAKRAKNYANSIGTDVIICYKERKKANEIENMNCIGKVKNRNVIFLDDMVDTARSLVIAANLIKKKGASSVRALVTHSILSENAIERIEYSFLEELIATDSIPFKKKLSSKIKLLSCAVILADVINLVHNNSSIRKYII